MRGRMLSGSRITFPLKTFSYFCGQIVSDILHWDVLIETQVKGKALLGPMYRFPSIQRRAHSFYSEYMNLCLAQE
jgi:hypothetical protein